MGMRVSGGPRPCSWAGAYLPWLAIHAWQEPGYVLLLFRPLWTFASVLYAIRSSRITKYSGGFDCLTDCWYLSCAVFIKWFEIIIRGHRGLCHWCFRSFILPGEYRNLTAESKPIFKRFCRFLLSTSSKWFLKQKANNWLVASKSYMWNLCISI